MKRNTTSDYAARTFTPAAFVLVAHCLETVPGFIQGEWVRSEDRSGRVRPETLASALALLIEVGMAEVAGNNMRLTRHGRRLHHGLGYARWAIGYGSFLPHVLDLAYFDTPLDGTTLRDGAAIARGSAEIGCRDVDPYLRQIVLAQPYAVVTDIGCGSAQWLTEVVSVAPTTVRGVGVDISPAAVEMARENIARAGLSSRVEIVCADAAEAARQVPPADLVVARFVLHDVVNADRRALNRVADLVSTGGRLVFAEVEPHQEGSSFAAAFTFVHALMGQSLFTQQEWRELLAASGLTVGTIVKCNMPQAFVGVAAKGGKST